jgi:hypothetical protein
LLTITPAPNKGHVYVTDASGEVHPIPTRWRPLEKEMTIERRPKGAYPQDDLQFALNIAF